MIKKISHEEFNKLRSVGFWDTNTCDTKHFASRYIVMSTTNDAFVCVYPLENFGLMIDNPTIVKEVRNLVRTDREDDAFSRMIEIFNSEPVEFSTGIIIEDLVSNGMSEIEASKSLEASMMCGYQEVEVLNKIIIPHFRIIKSEWINGSELHIDSMHNKYIIYVINNDNLEIHCVTEDFRKAEDSYMNLLIDLSDDFA